MAELDGAKAVVTGGSRGIGRAFAHRLSSLGAGVAVLDRDLGPDPAAGGEVVDAITGSGGEALGLACDVTDRAAVETAVGTVVSQWGRVDILICNAGGGSGELDENRASELDQSELHQVLDRNLTGTINTCTAVAPAMKRQGSGKIVTMASQAGVAAKPNGSYAHYGTAKAGVAMYTRYLAQDLGPHGITVNCIAPGRIATDRMLPKFEHMGVERLTSELALPRLGTPEDCADVAQFLCTSLSGYVTGAVIPVDGGATRHPV